MPENFEKFNQPNPEQEPRSKEEEPEIKKEREVEQELSPEVVEQIMEKVEEFFLEEEKRGISGIPTERVESILRQGLIGARPTKMPSTKSEVDVSQWKHESRTTKDTVVHFNILGRSMGSLDRLAFEPWDVYITFDLSRYKEDVPKDLFREGPTKFKPHTFVANDPEVAEIWRRFGDPQPGSERAKDYSKTIRRRYRGIIDENGRPTPDFDWGFVLHPRVPPRLFRGIIIPREIIPTRQAESLNTVTNTQTKIYNETQSIPLPIYDQGGNLIWPKKMSYKEVKKFVAEREKQQEKEQK